MQLYFLDVHSSRRDRRRYETSKYLRLTLMTLTTQQTLKTLLPSLCPPHLHTSFAVPTPRYLAKTATYLPSTNLRHTKQAVRRRGRSGQVPQRLSTCAKNRYETLTHTGAREPQDLHTYQSRTDLENRRERPTYRLHPSRINQHRNQSSFARFFRKRSLTFALLCPSDFAPPLPPYFPTSCPVPQKPA
jgi:hypothetical protein